MPRNDTYVCIYIYVYIRFLKRQRHSYFTYTDKVNLYFCENVHWLLRARLVRRTMIQFLKSQRHCYEIHIVTVLFTFWECDGISDKSVQQLLKISIKFLKSQRRCYVIYIVTVLFTFWEYDGIAVRQFVENINIQWIWFFENLYLLLRARLVCRTAASIHSQKMKSTVYFFDWCVYTFNEKAKITSPFRHLIAKSDIYCILFKIIRLYVHDCGADFPEITKFTLLFRKYIAKSEMHCIFLYSIFIYPRLDVLTFWEGIPAASSTMVCRTMIQFLKSQRHCYVIYIVTVLLLFEDIFLLLRARRACHTMIKFLKSQYQSYLIYRIIVFFHCLRMYTCCFEHDWRCA